MSFAKIQTVLQKVIRWIWYQTSTTTFLKRQEREYYLEKQDAINSLVEKQPQNVYHRDIYCLFQIYPLLELRHSPNIFFVIKSIEPLQSKRLQLLFILLLSKNLKE